MSKMVVGVVAAMLACGCAATVAAPSPSSPGAAVGDERVSSASPTSGDRFCSETVGFGIVKPRAWVFASVESDAANRRRASLGNDALDQRIREHGAAPLVVILKHAEPFTALNPTVKIALRPLGKLANSPPREIAEVVVAGMKQMVRSFELDSEIEDTRVAGQPAARFRARFSVEALEQQVSYPVLSRSWLIPRGPDLFIVSMSGPTSGEDISEAEFARILSSIELRC